MIRKTLFVFSFFIFSTSISLFAQSGAKYGHTNLGNLLEIMPESKKANDDLNAYTQKLVTKGDSLAKIFEAEVAVFQKHYQEGTKPMIELQKMQQDLQLKQEALQKFDRESQESAAVKRDELLKPILTKVQDAIKAVAKANGYLMVFDVSGGSMLYAAESDDVTPLIKKQLGIQ